MLRHSNYFYDQYMHREDTEQVEAKRFLHKYDAQASESNRMYAVREPYRYAASYDISSLPATFEVRQERYIEMYIPQDKFRELVSNERYIRELEQEVQHFKGIASKHITDARVRESNPVVKKAWEKYVTLLELVRK